MSLIDDITTASFWRARKAWRKLQGNEQVISNKHSNRKVKHSFR